MSQPDPLTPAELRDIEQRWERATPGLSFALRRKDCDDFAAEVRRSWADIRALLASDARLRAAASALIAALDACKPEMDAVATIAHVHGHRYDGPGFYNEREALRAALAGGGHPHV